MIRDWFSITVIFSISVWFTIIALPLGLGLVSGVASPKAQSRYYTEM